MDYSLLNFKDTTFLNSLFKDAINSNNNSLIKSIIEELLDISIIKIENLNNLDLEKELTETFCAIDSIITKENGEKIVVELAYSKTFDDQYLLEKNQELYNLNSPNSYPTYQILFLDQKKDNQFINKKDYADHDSRYEKRIEIDLPYIDSILQEKGINDLSPVESFAYLLEKGLTDDIVKKQTIKGDTAYGKQK